MMESTSSHHDVKIWLHSMVEKLIAVVIIQKSRAEVPLQVIWRGKGKVVRCVQDGVVLDLKVGGASWWNKFWGLVHVVSRWIPKPLSVPYVDLAIDLDPITGVKTLVVDAATWKRSSEEFQNNDLEGM